MQALKQRVSRKRPSKVPKNLNCTDPGLSQYYYSRRYSSKLRDSDFPLESGAVGIYSPWALLWFCCFMVAPLAYIYILLMLLRDLCQYFPETIYQKLQMYVPYLARLADMMKGSSRIMDVWCVIEGLFFVACKLKIAHLQGKDPLEASLSAAPMLDPEERKELWDRMMDVEKDDMATFISGWFFDHSIAEISRYDACDFICWAMFDGRNQEHLTTEELHDLESFLEDVEYRISLQLNGESQEKEKENVYKPMSRQSEWGEPLPNKMTESCDDDDDLSSTSESTSFASQRRPKPRKRFRFAVETHREEPTFFSNIYESYKIKYEHYKNMIENADFHPVQDFRNVLTETAHHAEESAMATAQSVYETIVQPGSNVDKHLSALSHATSTQLHEAWNSVKGMKERLETANFLSQQRNALMEQLRGNRAMLTRMREMSYAVPSKQMAALMRKITECYDALERVENRARDGFVRATGVLADRGNALFPIKEPQRCAKYSLDPLFGINTYPLGLHFFVLVATEIPLRFMLRNRGFEKRCIGPVTYYHHPGLAKNEEKATQRRGKRKIPIVFVHGIGVGIIAYMELIDHLLKTGHPILLPEIPYVSGFRVWQSASCVLSPAVVSSTMTAMLATHGYSKATFVGHSYGTSWLSYVCKFAPSSVAALLFLDPICFCLHYPRLTKSFVYSRPDPGNISFVIRTDMMVNWTIQRAFPWAWITLFLDQIHVPCTIFLGDKDSLVPAQKVENYFRSRGIPIHDAAADESFDDGGDIHAFVFRGACHGDFTEIPSQLPPIVAACRNLCEKVEGKETS